MRSGDAQVPKDVACVNRELVVNFFCAILESDSPPNQPHRAAMQTPSRNCHCPSWNDCHRTHEVYSNKESCNDYPPTFERSSHPLAPILRPATSQRLGNPQRFFALISQRVSAF